MGTRWYGSLNNRLEEGKNYIDDKIVKEGTDITMYYWSDRHCYFVTRVIDQKHIFVKQYHVCADHDKAGGMGHQDWLYFKTAKEENDYLSKHRPDIERNPREYPEEEWVFRYGHWNDVTRWNLDKLKKEDRTPELMFEGKELEKINRGEDVCKYHKLQPISFGVRDHYYDWSF